MLVYEPTFSPWGEIQDCRELCSGFFLVTTPGHGGVMVEREQTKLLSAAARKCGFRDGGYLCFEEDCDEQIVLRELLDKGMWKIPNEISDKARFEKELNDHIKMWHPEYWAARAARRTARKPSQRKEQAR